LGDWLLFGDLLFSDSYSRDFLCSGGLGLTGDCLIWGDEEVFDGKYEVVKVSLTSFVVVDELSFSLVGKVVVNVSLTSFVGGSVVGGGGGGGFGFSFAALPFISFVGVGFPVAVEFESLVGVVGFGFAPFISFVGVGFPVAVEFESLVGVFGFGFAPVGINPGGGVLIGGFLGIIYVDERFWFGGWFGGGSWFGG